MGRTARKSNVGVPKRVAMLGFSNANAASNRQIATAFDVDENTVRNIQKRASEADKENIDPYSEQAHQQRPRPGRPPVISLRTQRQLIRHATKNRFQRLKARYCPRNWL